MRPATVRPSRQGGAPFCVSVPAAREPAIAAWNWLPDRAYKHPVILNAQRKNTRPGLPIWLRITAVGVLAFIGVAASLAYRDSLREPAEDAPRVEFTIEGLDCPVWCAVRLTESIDGLDGARVERMDQKTGKVIVQHDPARQNEETLRKLFGERGFPVQSSQAVVTSK